MCGIGAMLGSSSEDLIQAPTAVMEFLKRLEYRGYDSAGIATIMKKSQIGAYSGAGRYALEARKAVGVLSNLKKVLDERPLQGSISIGHTRWATHGIPSEKNAHPHFSPNEKYAVVHNGKLVNSDAVRLQYEENGHTFRSDTDTEVIVHGIEWAFKNGARSLQEAVALAVDGIPGKSLKLDGSYAICVISADHPDQLVVARHGGPLVFGYDDDRNFYASSDESTLANFATHVVKLEDSHMAILHRGGKYQIFGINGEAKIDHKAEPLTVSVEQFSKGDFSYYMEKEIKEQPSVLRNALSSRIDPVTGVVRLGLFEEDKEMGQAVQKETARLIVIACGSSLHGSRAIALQMQHMTGMDVVVQEASEFARGNGTVIRRGDFGMLVSQSGTTADIAACIPILEKRRAILLGVINRVSSQIASKVGRGVYTHAGPERAVGSTKAVMAQMVAQLLFATMAADYRGTMTPNEIKNFGLALRAIPDKLDEVLALEPLLKRYASEIKDARSLFILGSGTTLGIADEGVLKMQEIAYMNAHAFAAGALKHGPLALVDDGTPVIAMLSDDGNAPSIMGNVQEAMARKAKALVLSTLPVDETDALRSRIMSVTKTSGMYEPKIVQLPSVIPSLAPLVNLIPLQLIAYHAGIMNGVNVDQPRNLAKSVTV